MIFTAGRAPSAALRLPPGGMLWHLRVRGSSPRRPVSCPAGAGCENGVLVRAAASGTFEKMGSLHRPCAAGCAGAFSGEGLVHAAAGFSAHCG